MECRDWGRACSPKKGGGKRSEEKGYLQEWSAGTGGGLQSREKQVRLQRTAQMCAERRYARPYKRTTRDDSCIGGCCGDGPARTATRMVRCPVRNGGTPTVQLMIDEKKAYASLSAEPAWNNFAALAKDGNGVSPFSLATNDDQESDLEDDQVCILQHVTNFADDLDDEGVVNWKDWLRGQEYLWKRLNISILQALLRIATVHVLYARRDV